jgi:hypothetical protein
MNLDVPSALSALQGYLSLRVPGLLDPVTAVQGIGRIMGIGEYDVPAFLSFIGDFWNQGIGSLRANKPFTGPISLPCMPVNTGKPR